MDGHYSKEGIASAFKPSFEANSRPNNPLKVDELNSQFYVKYREFSQNHLHNCNCANHNFTLKATIDAVFSLKQGKSGDDGGLQAEHFYNAPLILFIRLTSLFNSMKSHSFVSLYPHNFAVELSFRLSRIRTVTIAM